MITFYLNHLKTEYIGDENRSLLHYLREIAGITSVKDGCSGQAACGACMVEIDGKARLSCTRKMKFLEGSQVFTMEGIPEVVRDVIARAYVEKGAVQCGFCTPGLIMRTKVLFAENPTPDRDQIKKAINLNLCRCTGYVKIIDAIEAALKNLRESPSPGFDAPSGQEKRFYNEDTILSGLSAGIGESLPKYEAYATAIGKRLFVDDMRVKGLLHSALRLSDHPRARVIAIDTTEARQTEGVIRVFTASDIPGERFTGLIVSDWPLMIAPGEITRYIGDVIAGVVAVDEITARRAAQLIQVEYEVLEPVADPQKALEPDSPRVHPEKPNLLEKCLVRRGDPVDPLLLKSAFQSSGIYETQRIEHAFLETEAAVALPEGDGIHLFSQGQGIYVDQRQVASLLGLGEDQVHVTLVPCGGGFGGREDMTVQGHAALFAFLLQQPVKLHLSREESIIMHPKRHPVWMDIALGCDKAGKLTALRLKAIGDTGAYASVGAKVMERVAGHAGGGYHFPSVDIESLTVYTNNIPSGAMRGFGANQAAFALESCIDDLCAKGGFDRWKFRYDNALEKGKMTATGQILGEGVGIKACLLALKDQFYAAKYAGLACGIKNSGVGNGMTDFCDVRINVLASGRISIEHGWTEMGQGVQNIAIQTLHQETGINASMIDVVVDTSACLPTGMTTSSRATALLGNAIIDASAALRQDLDQFTPGCLDIAGNAMQHALLNLAGNTYPGKYYCDWTTKPGADVDKIITHYSYGYAAQLVVLNETGEVDKVYAAHDAGKIMNPMLFEGQIQGAVHMGLGYALSEDLPMKEGRLESLKLSDCGVLNALQTPEIIVIGIEEADPVGPYGAKGIGEIGLVPTAAAVANALFQFDGIRRKRLPMKK
ncbi:MAG: selenium-dependent xanthine dehydrogenase [Bacteroidetes bacterium]|nr:selenium-dependent xanthine dehydrogenase [Bacteroidota bacterium]